MSKKKSCLICSKYDKCQVRSICAGTHVNEIYWYCSDFERKKKTVKLYRYTYTSKDGVIGQTTWTTHKFIDYSSSFDWKLLEKEEKEIEV